ncbi:hypothetical protein PR202_ga27576 [Eleusine coracana subsp. coracana]|uniref:Uncharacterized protein n=1 Tax=Eleusine coracana subsp. coracana TaxID=191504 RepID=A0AAV5DHC0_ELECO|nr:hypothetical protein PR202_ga27576 [Eleusine coracana subsp. coracana]
MTPIKGSSSSRTSVRDGSGIIINKPVGVDKSRPRGATRANDAAARRFLEGRATVNYLGPSATTFTAASSSSLASLESKA